MSAETATSVSGRRSPRSLRDLDPMLAAYRGSSFWTSVWQLVSTLALFALTWTAACFAMRISYGLTLLLTVPAALLVVRLFILQHDCGHRSFFKSTRANDAVGFCLSMITFTPYTYWRRTHAMHHACSGDLDRRGKSGEIFTMTVEEYRQANWWQRLCYRVYRHPLVLFGVGPFLHFAICQRLTGKIPATWKKERRGVHLTNAGLLLIALAMSWLVGPLTFLMVQIPIMVISASIGVWLFYMQHQYEDAYWKRGEDWDYIAAAMAGSSHYRLPRILRWFTGSIGLHHVHHLDARIPNYRLQQCHDDNPELQQVQEFTLWESLACVHSKLWDERQQRMVGFKAARVAGQDDDCQPADCQPADCQPAERKPAERVAAVREERATGVLSRS